MDTVMVTGTSLDDFLDFLEEKKDQSKKQAIAADRPDPYEDFDYSEVTNEKDGGVGVVDLIALLLTGAIALITNLVTEYYKNKAKAGNELTFTVGKDGPKVTLKGLTEEEVAQKLKEIAEAASDSGA